MRTVLVTGSSGFIGFFTCKRLLEDGYRVIGIDSMNDYYDVSLKNTRQSMLLSNNNFHTTQARIEGPKVLMELFKAEKPDVVIHLAAQAGVRYSIDNPRSYLEGNIIGTFELLEAARAFPPQHMLFASTSSVYGANKEQPYKEIDKADHQVSFYAATKKASESMAHSYSHLFNLPITIFRFFTVYGPWGRPDMAPYKFTKAILSGEPIDVYNNGNMERDFTYITDLVEAIRLLLDVVPDGVIDGLRDDEDSRSPVAPYRVVNIGNSKAVKLTDFIEAIEFATGINSIRNLLPMQPGDVKSTLADATLLNKLTGYYPKTNIIDGTNAYVDWFKEYYNF